ncbi:hypothetical protein [Anaeromyxobacter oryzae]|uniref:Lipoprotein n=1 Tax=Anaeromyxobacter oryzae TaxID=2918170 RepID=A0ABM7WP77_9BACT|nr:hypothetical protein [Anaeromyxobacter oryzae]BDG01260.1 hypothetical protein AMOR_02560 [Anaeromyxobacter oryzae]
MGTTRRWALPCAGLLAMAGTGCASMRGEKSEASNPTANRVQAQQETSQKALESANDAQKKAADQEQKAAQAQAQVQKDQQQLTQDQQKAEQQQAKAQQTQQQANQLTQQSSQQAQQAQQQASQTLAEQGQQVRRGELTVAGQVTRASSNQLAVRSRSGDDMSFRITNQTQILLDGQPASAADIQQGADARVAYEAGGTVPTATHVQVMSGNPTGSRAGAGASQPGSDTGTGSSGAPGASARSPGSDTSGTGSSSTTAQPPGGAGTGASQRSAPPPQDGVPQPQPGDKL